MTDLIETKKKHLSDLIRTKLKVDYISTKLPLLLKIDFYFTYIII